MIISYQIYRCLLVSLHLPPSEYSPRLTTSHSRCLYCDNLPSANTQCRSVIFVLIYFLVLVLVSEILFSFSFVLVFSHFLVLVLEIFFSLSFVLVFNSFKYNSLKV